MVFLSVHELAFLFGVLGNIVSFGVFLSPVPTFYGICKRKSSKGFQSIPYICALASATLLLCYGIMKGNALLIISINTFGCVIEISYLLIYLIYAPRDAKIFTLKLILIFNVGALGLLILLVDLFVPKLKRVTAVGWVCAAYSLAVFAAPLSIMRKVIRTKSVEYMPFLLSFSLTLNAVMWFLYGLLIKDKFIAMPNILGFLFGLVQMVLYLMYKNSKKTEMPKPVPTENQETKDLELNSIEIVAVESPEGCVKEMKKPIPSESN
ncbi:PREDICTED: bidirectional sugar transporter SWEET9 [Tarenaya hassleriana]|uniref:bidirectional sugar transporter SWEET9 n=1 Tax=Tarenaya hassleriana TaxID=28532 RepID=UPI00053CA5E6|nr:PREDICTED: bidirectional sugar transporter SWEET9 [Tarenaya hassleriana]